MKLTCLAPNFPPFMVVMACALMCSPSYTHAQHHPVDPDEGTLSSIRPRIPEPMVFDLIRPLGAQRGEFEINSLFRFSPTNTPRQLLWAPEIEYAFLEGYGVEFELPMENAHIDSWKGAIQGTLPGPWKKKFIQGWQLLGEKNRGGGNSKVDLMYLAGSRWHHNWSAFSMTGIERESGRHAAYAFLGNYSLFFHQRDSVTYGLESNLKGTGNSGRGLLLMPQVQLRKSRLNLQVGAGWRWIRGTGELQAGWRLSREF
jgi:hypothetical protein